MYSVFITILLSTFFNVRSTEPFSFAEVNQLEQFDLKKPNFIPASDGVNLAYYAFVPEQKAKHAVILYAGAGLYGNKTYQWVAKTLQEKYDIATYIFDVRGHGHSEGERGDAPSVEQVWQDVALAVAFVKGQYESAEIYLVGHSSGAALIMNYALYQSDHQEEGYIFLAPYLGPKAENVYYSYADSNKNFIKSVRWWVYILGSIFSNSFVAHWKAVLFNYPQRVLEQDPLIVDYYTYAMSMATTPYEIGSILPSITKKSALFIGKNDEQFIPEQVLEYGKLLGGITDMRIVDDVAHISLLLKAPELIAHWITNQKEL